jgi:acetoin utilization protein AcuB
MSRFVTEHLRCRQWLRIIGRATFASAAGRIRGHRISDGIRGCANYYEQEHTCMIVGMWMSRNLLTVQPNTRISEAAQLMRDNAIRRLPIARRDGNELLLLGLVSASDLYQAFPPHLNPFAVAVSTSSADEPQGVIEQIMRHEVVTTTADTPIEDAASVMRDAKIGALPVVRGGHLIGLITESDIFRAFISILRDGADGVRVTFSTPAEEDVFQVLADRTRHRKVKVLSLMSSRRDGQTTYVVRMVGPEVQQTIDDLWHSGHQVLNILRSFPTA